MAEQRLSDLLLRSGLLAPDQVEEALREHHRSGVRLGQVVVDLGFADENSLYERLAQISGLARLALRAERLDRASIRFVDSIWALDNGMVPLSVDESRRTLRVAVTDPTRLEPLDELSFNTGLRIESVLGSEAEIGRLIRHQFFEEPLDPTAHDHQFDLPPPAEPPRSTPIAPTLSPPDWGGRPEITGEEQAIGWMQAMVDSHKENVRLLQALFELCVARGLITREEYLARLNEEDRH